MKQDKFSNEMPEQVILTPKPRRITINNTRVQRAYGLFDTVTGTQVSEFIKGNDEQIVFNNLNPSIHYDVGVIEYPRDGKPEFAMSWNQTMKDNTEEILNNSDDLPVQYPKVYVIRYKGTNSDGVYDLTDDKGETVGQVAQLAPQDDKPYFIYAHTFRMKDDNIK